MKTFDIAINYLQEIDFRSFEIIIKEATTSKTNEDFKEAIKSAHGKFIADKNNNTSNDYYRNICFSTALYHLIFKAHGWVSFFDVAQEIVGAHKEIINTEFETYLHTEYPKVMVDDWIKYCEDLKGKTLLLEGEIRQDLFFAAYHYFTETD